MSKAPSSGGLSGLLNGTGGAPAAVSPGAAAVLKAAAAGGTEGMGAAAHTAGGPTETAGVVRAAPLNSQTDEVATIAPPPTAPVGQLTPNGHSANGLVVGQDRMLKAPANVTPLLSAKDVTLQYKTKDHLVTATYRVSFDVYDAKGNYNMAPNGIHEGTVQR